MARCTLPSTLTKVRWQDQFLAILPAIRRHAAMCFRRHSDREEAVAEAAASAYIAYSTLARHGRLSQAFPSTLARFAASAVVEGRHVGGRVNSRDVLCPYARRKRG